MKSWIVLVKANCYSEPLWVGNVEVTDDAPKLVVKDQIHRFVSQHFGEPAKIVRIAKGRVDISFLSDPIDFDSF